MLSEDSTAAHKNFVLKSLAKKKRFRTGKCQMCWHDPRNCICSELPSISINKKIEIVVYIDSKEILNAGDDAKLLKIVCPDKSSRFIYAAEDEELVKYIQTKSSENVVVLFPSDSAISFWDFVHQTSAKDSSFERRAVNVLDSINDLTIIAVDAVWRHARRMATRLKELLPSVRHVQLTPEQMSVYARKQTQPDRICTVEAIALFLSHLGESESATEGLIECVRINNNALRPRAKHCSLSTSGEHYSGSVLYKKIKDATHPCWYFGQHYYCPDKEKTEVTTEKSNK